MLSLANAFSEEELAEWEARNARLAPEVAGAGYTLEVKIDGRAGNEERRLEFGLPADWQDPSTATDAGGNFALVFAPPRAYCFELEAKRPGYAREKREWFELLEGDVKDLGEVELIPGGAIEGRLLDPSGAPILGEHIEVNADGQTKNLVRSPGAREATYEYAPVDQQTGAFRLEDLAPGRVHLTALRRRNAWIDGPQVVVQAGETVTQDLVYHGPDLAQRITVSTSTRVFHPVRPEREAIHLTGPGIEPRTPATDPPRIHLVFDGLAPGEYTLAIDDPRFLPWSQVGVTPGTEVRIATSLSKWRGPRMPCSWPASIRMRSV